MNRRVTGARGYHDLRHRVNGGKRIAAHAEAPVIGGAQLDLALADLGRTDAAVTLHDLAEADGGVILVEHARLELEHIDAALPHREQHVDILRSHDVALTESSSLEFAGNDLGHVVAEHVSHCLPNGKFPH